MAAIQLKTSYKKIQRFLIASSNDDQSPDELTDVREFNQPRSRKPATEGLRAWLAVMNASLNAIEQVAWQGRALAEKGLQAWRKAEEGAESLKSEYQSFSEEASQWAARLKRLKKTGWMLTKVTSSYRVWGIKSAFMTQAVAEQKFQQLHERNAALFRDISLAQGGAFLKVGQLLSARGDILPKPWVDALSTLQDRAQAEPFEVIKAHLEAAFKQPLETTFAQFDKTPLAAASIGQVHKATLHDGRNVAVKIQRPDLAPIIELDMQLLKLFSNSIASMLPPTDMETIVNEVERSVRAELDYLSEASATDDMANFVAELDGVSVPKPIWSHCRSRVMTTEFVEGQSLTKVLQERHQAGDGETVSLLLGRLLDLYLRQVLQAGTFQADPHPGNFLVNSNGDLVQLDFGCTMTLDPQFKDNYFKALGAALTDNRDALAEILFEMGFRTQTGEPDTLFAFSDVLLDQIKNAATNIEDGQIQWPEASDLLQQGQVLLAHMESDPVERIPAEFIMLARVFTTIGGLFAQYKPQLDINKYLIPHLVGPMIQMAR